MVEVGGSVLASLADAARAGADWRRELRQWLRPYLAALPRRTQRHWAPRYIEGLLGPSPRKSMEPIAALVAGGAYDQLHHFLTTTAWDPAPLGAVLLRQAQRWVGGPDAVAIIDDTTLLKQGHHSVGVARQYSGAAGKVTNCQTLVSLTLARGEVPLPLALELFLPAEWTADPRRCARAGVPKAERRHREKWQRALAMLDRARAAGVTFGLVAADAAYGSGAAFRQGLSARGLLWAVGISAQHLVYPAAVRESWRTPTGRRARTPHPLTAPRAIADVAAGLRWRWVEWRSGTKGPLLGQFAAVRVRVADGPALGSRYRGPGEAVWLVAERRADERECYYVSNLPATARLVDLVRAIKMRWACEQAHQQLKEELGLDHFEGRSWAGLQHHVLLTLLAFAFLQQRRLRELAPPEGGKKTRHARAGARRPAGPEPARGAARAPRRDAGRLVPLHPRAASSATASQ